MLTTAQALALKADVEADAAFASVPHNSDGAFTVAAAYNLAASPAYVVWRTKVSRDELQQLDTFDWTQIDNLSVGKSRIWDWMFMRGAEINAAKANVRAGIAACLVGNASLLAMQTAVLTACKRNSTRAEKLFATGSGTTLSPSVMNFEGDLGYQDVATAMGW
jgi:hypothetical protein